MSANRDTTRREELLFMLRHGGASSDGIAERVVDMAFAEVRAETQAEDCAAITEVMAVLHDAPAATEALQQASDAIASGGTGIEYGVAVQPHGLGVGRVLDPTPNRDEAERRLIRYSDMGVTRLVQRTVHHDAWTEVAS